MVHDEGLKNLPAQEEEITAVLQCLPSMAADLYSSTAHFYCNLEYYYFLMDYETLKENVSILRAFHSFLFSFPDVFTFSSARKNLSDPEKIVYGQIFRPNFKFGHYNFYISIFRIRI